MQDSFFIYSAHIIALILLLGLSCILIDQVRVLIWSFIDPFFQNKNEVKIQ